MTRRDDDRDGKCVFYSAPGMLRDSTRHMAVQLRFDRESFDALKDLLREASAPKVHIRGDEDVHARVFRESLKRVFDQLRDKEYSDV
jgi:hypothetical protein